MLYSPGVSRRRFVRSASLLTVGGLIPGHWLAGTLAAGLASKPSQPLEQFDYSDVALTSDLHEKQLEETHSVLMGLSDDSLLKPFRQMSGLPAPGEDLGGWYHYNPDYQWGKDEDGFAPSCTFGQWISALARMYAIRRDQPTRDKVLRLNRLYAQTISGDYYDKNRFPTYCYDKIVGGRFRKLWKFQVHPADPESLGSQTFHNVASDKATRPAHERRFHGPIPFKLV